MQWIRIGIIFPQEIYITNYLFVVSNSNKYSLLFYAILKFLYISSVLRKIGHYYAQKFLSIFLLLPGLIRFLLSGTKFFFLKTLNPMPSYP